MSYQICDYDALGPKYRSGRDPRRPIVSQMGWYKQPGAQTTWAGLEPDVFNRAVQATRPIDCPLVRDAIYYKDRLTNKWWSVYYVAEENETAFLAWLETQNIEIYWCHKKSPKPRPRRPLLWNRKDSEDFNENERLFTMGYYAKFSSKYFSEDDKKLLERLGPVRTAVLENGLE